MAEYEAQNLTFGLQNSIIKRIMFITAPDSVLP